MTSITFRSPVTRTLHHKPWLRPAGSLDFRVTQEFDDRDFFYNDGRLHNATDIGNARCNDPIVAMAPGTAHRIKDNATDRGGAEDALGIRIDHGHGVTTEYWHLNGYSVADGAKVKGGQQIGILGSTGLGGVCHCHIELKVNGVRRDPEPHMFGVSLTIGLPDTAMPQEDPVISVVKGEDWKPTITSGVSNGVLRAAPDRALAPFARVSAGTVIRSVAEVIVDTPPPNHNWRITEFEGKPAYMLRTDWEPLASDADQQLADLLARKLAPGTNQIAAARTAVDGVIQAALAAQRALA